MYLIIYAIHPYTPLHAFFKLFPKMPSLRILLNLRVRVCKGVSCLLIIIQSYINVTMPPMSPQKPKYSYFAFPEKTFEIG